MTLHLAIAVGFLALTGCANTEKISRNSSGDVDSAIRQITRLMPRGWHIADRESNVVPPGFLNRNGGEYILLRGPRDQARAPVPPYPRLSANQEKLSVWIVPRSFRPKRPGLIQLLQLAVVPTPPSFSAGNDKIHIYAEEFGNSSWNWPKALIDGLHLHPAMP